MKRIYKYNLDPVESQIVEIPSSRILSVEEQNNNIVVYALVDDEMELMSYEFIIKGTGHLINFNVMEYDFLGTVKLDNGNLMFHVFYRKCTVEKSSEDIKEDKDNNSKIFTMSKTVRESLGLKVKRDGVIN